MGEPRGTQKLFSVIEQNTDKNLIIHDMGRTFVRLFRDYPRVFSHDHKSDRPVLACVEITSPSADHSVAGRVLGNRFPAAAWNTEFCGIVNEMMEEEFRAVGADGRKKIALEGKERQISMYFW
ncbi:MAG: hypothetical protein K2O73_05440 [Lachnospiraceae bacterium]|nr:hypothetical protein [Lachnospiraceae bacterium]